MLKIKERIADHSLLKKVITAEEAVKFIRDGMTIGTFGGNASGYPKKVFSRMIENIQDNHLTKITLFSTGVLGSEIDARLAEAGIMRRRLGQQANSTLRKFINKGEISYVELRPSTSPLLLQRGIVGDLDLAIIEASFLTKEGGIVPTTAVVDGPALVKTAKKIIIEINTRYPNMQGLHDIYEIKESIDQKPIPLCFPDQRIGKNYIQVDKDKIVGIVESNIPDILETRIKPDNCSTQISRNLINFLEMETKKNHLPPNLPPLEVGIGSVPEAILAELGKSKFENIDIYSPALGDGVLDLVDSGKVRSVSGSAIFFSEENHKRFIQNIEQYKEKFILRQIEVCNAPEVIRRLGIISINGAIETDIYGNINSTHILGSQVITGIGGSGDFAQNGYLSIFVIPSVGKNGNISGIVPFVPHVDHPDHTVDVIVTEEGVADIRNLDPVERAKCIIDNCANLEYKSLLIEYLRQAISKYGGHQPHDLECAFDFYTRFNKTGTMKK